MTQINISNIESPVEVASQKVNCSDVEMMQDESHIYLGCRRQSYRIDRGSQTLSLEEIDGSKNFFRDTFVRHGRVYTVHSGMLFVSK